MALGEEGGPNVWMAGGRGGPDGESILEARESFSCTTFTCVKSWVWTESHAVALGSGAGESQNAGGKNYGLNPPHPLALFFKGEYFCAYREVLVKVFIPQRKSLTVMSITPLIANAGEHQEKRKT